MRHVIRRILFYVCAVWVAITLDFFIPRLAPGDPVAAIVGKMSLKGYVSPEMKQTLAATFGLDSQDPLWVQYFKYLGNLFHGNLGNSIQYFPTPVMQIIGQDIWWSIMLGGVAVILGFIIGCFLGIIVAWKRGSAVYAVLSPAMNFLSAIPYFWLALLSLYLFSYLLNWFPLSGGYDSANIDPGWTFDFISSVIQHAFLPALTLVVASLAGWMLTMRNSMITTLSEDYVLMAKAKGLSERRVMFWYAARNAMLQSIFLIITLAVLGANFLADMLYTFLDPRVRQERSA